MISDSDRISTRQLNRLRRRILRVYGTARREMQEQLTDFLETVNQRCQFTYWFFGHYHDNRIINDRYILQWEQISGLEI